MIYGNWVAIRKVFKKHLPDDRPYTKLEAVFSLSLDFDSGNTASYSGYSKLWKWSRNKVKKFMDDMEILILKPGTPEEIKLQKGKIKGHPKGHPQDIPKDKKGHPNFVYNMDLHGTKDTPENKKGHPKDTPKDTTINPIKIPNPKAIKKVSKKRIKKQKSDSPKINDFIDSLSEATKNLCREKNIGQIKFKQLSESCFDHFKGKGEQKADWEATVRNWIRNDEKFNGNTQNNNETISHPSHNEL